MTLTIGQLNALLNVGEHVTVIVNGEYYDLVKSVMYPCRNCVFFAECGDNMRTERCDGRVTK